MQERKIALKEVENAAVVDAAVAVNVAAAAFGERAASAEVAVEVGREASTAPAVKRLPIASAKAADADAAARVEDVVDRDRLCESSFLVLSHNMNHQSPSALSSSPSLKGQNTRS